MDNLEINVDIEPVDDMAVDEDLTSRVKAGASKRRGRGFGESRDRGDFGNGGFEALESEGTGKAQRSVEGWIVLVTNIHEEATEEDVQEKFAEYGNVKSLHLNLDRRTGFVKGYALVEYENYNQARTAIESASGSELLGRVLHVDFAFVRGASDSKSVQHVGGRAPAPAKPRLGVSERMRGRIGDRRMDMDADAKPEERRGDRDRDDDDRDDRRDRRERRR
ncbi:hypothetical protein HK105_200113 [Polyrhizophydium stewartii]|uniref:RRM domain-containing protein n=1 Tax=Polyrhizophydium stewartii TaxID=2732419 RepID=A0ABR4NKK0_9FUNG